jgi:hypothetical protein
MPELQKFKNSAGRAVIGPLSRQALPARNSKPDQRSGGLSRQNRAIWPVSAATSGTVDDRNPPPPQEAYSTV